MSHHMRFTVERTLSVAVGNLESLIECLRRGTLHISHRGRTLVLGPKQPVALALRIGSNREPSVGENKLTLTLGWERARPAPKMPGRQCHGKGDREDMASQHLGVKSKATMSEVIGHLEHLVASLKEGQLCIRKNDKVITLKPQDPLLIEIEAETRFDKESLREKLVIRMKWRKGQPRPAEGDAYTITHGEAPSEA